MKPLHHPSRAGQSLVEFAVVSLVLYMLLAAILTFGHMLYVAQGLQGAADLAAREISRTPFHATNTVTNAPLEFEDLINPDSGLDDSNNFRSRIFDEAWLVIDLAAFYESNPQGDVFQDLVPSMPLLNQQLTTLMIVDRPVVNGEQKWLMRYPGALLERQTPIAAPNGVDYSAVATQFAVGIPLVSSRDADGVETIRWVPVIEEIGDNPFRIDSDQRGIVALRINYPFQSASMSSFRQDPDAVDFPFEPTVGRPNAADDDAVIQLNPGDRPGELTGAPLLDGNVYAGTYGGQFGLGAQGALGSELLTGGRPVRPYRRVISAQAIYRREVFK